MLELGPDGVLQLRPFLSVTAGIIALFVGKSLNQRIAILREYNIPEPVTGGLLFSLGFWAMVATSGYSVAFELTARDVLLLYFFSTIGINARFADLREGGRPLLILLVLTVIFVVLQNLVGIAGATMLGLRPETGLLAGSVALMGGHGTTIAWAPTFAAMGVEKAAEIGIVCATMGLVLGSLSGGPLARFLIRRHGLKGSESNALDVGARRQGEGTSIEYYSFLHAILAIHICGIAGIGLDRLLSGAGIKMPLFVSCLVSGILISNLLPKVAPRVRWPSRTPALALIAEVSLGVFLAMSLMSMRLWELADLAGPIAVLLALQLAVMLLYAAFVMFRALDRNYDAAVISAGFAGFALGATPTAMANMTAVTQRYGASHVAFLVVPLVGAFFIDVINAATIRTLLAFFD